MVVVSSLSLFLSIVEFDVGTEGRVRRPLNVVVGN